ncbi:MMPL family transporter [Pengzhenrongella frigida]|uniref:MMPL family transporter n=1 Tax=Pengzhenrongella frigida TaxID=1259133 RepID=A0A4Q5MZX3_9MICO|nr:MMPL family transporter [Cellulomonas sp. HLT2-17]RYV51295.1 MMPL family transporter [Cellulomonas sp. HLT2-17]
MSSQLYRLGRAMARYCRSVLIVWVLLLTALGGAVVVSGGELEDSLSIPGTEAQDGLDVLAQRFPQVAGTSGQLLFVAPAGESIAEHTDQVTAVLDAVREVPDVVAVTDPFDPANALDVSADGAHAIATVQLSARLGDLDPATVPALETAAVPVGSDLEVHIGGAVFTQTSVHISPSEGLGLVVALLVLVITFGSLLAAGLPLLTAVLGIAVAMTAVLTIAAATPVSSTAPTLALMIGLAVGIDYALFVLSRHRSQLATGMDVIESIARSVATAGSAVVFAGATVIIALCGLFVVQIPFLTVMGLTAALAVAIAVLVALTALPALLAASGERLRPRPGSRAAARALVEQSGDEPTQGGRVRHTLGARWVALVTRVPVLTVVLVVVGLLAMAIPAKDLELGLPDNGTADVGTPQRETYDLVADAFGAGYNTPLLVTVDIIRTTDPVGVMADLADDLRGLDGVAAVGLATPNETADLGIVQVIPETGQADPATAALVAEIRGQRDVLEERYGITDLRVTGQVAVTIDVSDRLADALLPFGLFVVGLSLLLLTVVFRSIAVPLKATIGYVFSVLAAFGAVAAVFEWGWAADLLNVSKVGPVISFLPIILMGVLFGLAMDYEVFLVSRMREAYVHGSTAQRAVRSGFRASARVVTAAAIIMISVFAAFVPTATSTVKPIALGLAVGVFVDAFLVRMTLVPAVLALLGDRAWALPGWLDRRLPSLDVEGAALEHHLAHEAWVRTHGEADVRLDEVTVHDDAGAVVVGPVSAVARRGQILVVAEADPVARRALLAVVAGRLAPSSGTLVVLGRVLPDEAAAVRARVPYLAGPGAPALSSVHGRRLVVVDDVAEDETGGPTGTTWAELVALARAGTTVVVGCAGRTAALSQVPAYLVVAPRRPHPSVLEEVAP